MRHAHRTNRATGPAKAKRTIAVIGLSLAIAVAMQVSAGHVAGQTIEDAAPLTIPSQDLGADSDSLVDQAGGQVQSLDGTISISIPPGTVDAPTRVVLTSSRPVSGSDVILQFDIALASLDAKSRPPLKQSLSGEVVLPPGEAAASVSRIERVLDDVSTEPVPWDAVPLNPSAVSLPSLGLGTYRVITETAPLPSPVAASVDSKGEAVEFAVVGVKLDFPADAVAEIVDVEYRPIEPTGIKDLQTVRQFELNARAINRAGAAVSEFSNPVSLTVQHGPGELLGLDPGQLKLYSLNEVTGEWEAVSDQEVSGGAVTARLNHFSVYATAASSYISGPGNILWHQGDEHAGASTYAIPIETPAGPGGFNIPPLALDYNSSRVDEMKSAQSVGSWAGIGWDVSIPSIRRDPTTSRYFLEMGGAFDQLISTGTDTDGSTKWSTRNELYARIRSKASADPFAVGQHNVFIVTLKDGTQYRFGTQGTLDEQNDGWARWYWTWTGSSWQRHYYRIDLARVVDTHQVYADYTYTRNSTSYCPTGASNPTCQTNIQAANLQYAYWGGQLSVDPAHRFRVFFGVSTRSDWPVCAGLEPLVYEIRRITAIKVQVLVSGSWNNLARRYNLTYDPVSGSGPVCPLAGKLKLSSVKLFGTDGDVISPAPVPLHTTTFTYTDKFVEYKNAIDQQPPCRSYSRPYLATVTNGFGTTATLSYETKWVAGPAGTDPDCSGSSNVATWSRQVLASRIENPGVGTPITHTYTYTNGPRYYQDPGLNPIDAEYRGFREIRDTDALFDYRLCKYFTTGLEDTGQQGDPLTGHPYVCAWYESSGVALRTEWRWWLTRSVATDVNFVYEFLRDTTLMGITRSQGFSYDWVGNLYQAEELTPGLYRKTVSNYSGNVSSWIVDTLALESVYNSAGGTPIQKTAYLYDGNTSYLTAPTKGDLTKLERYDESESAHALMAYQYDDYGNRTRETKYRDAATSFFTDFTYDTTYHSYLVSETHTTNASPPVVLTTLYGYDFVLGKQTLKTDPNGSQFKTNYDKYSRVTSEVSPGDTDAQATTVYEYNWDSTAPNQTVTKSREQAGTSNVLTSWEWQDGQQRSIQSRSEGPGCTADSVTDTEYDAVGQMLSTSIPYWATNAGCSPGGYTTPNPTIGKTFNEYDALGRETKTTQPGGGIRTTTYAGSSASTIDENGHKTENVSDPLGRLISVKEYTDTCLNPCGSNPFDLYATTTFTYDALDRQTGTADAATPANVWANTYNRLGFLTQSVDPDRGTWTYTYYDDGLLKAKSDARTPTAQTITYVYDSLGRLSSKSYSGYSSPATVTYSYDACELDCPDNLSKGNLTRVNDWAGTHKTKFDARGRVTKEEHTIDSVPYSVSYAYDSLDRVTTTTYPDAEAVTSVFDNQGSLETLSSSLGGPQFITATDNNAAGMPTSVNMGNGVTVENTYNETTDLRLARIKASKPPTLFDQTYIYDLLGQMKTVTDSLDGPGGSTSTIGYDERDRVTHVTGLDDTTIAYSYDTIGNITAKQESGPVGAESTNFPTIAYGVGAPGPHAATTATPFSGGAQTYEYDANGNVLMERVGGTPRNEYQYDAEGRASALLTHPGPVTSLYTHGDDGAQFTRVSNGAAGTTVYIAGVYEKNTVSGVVTVTKYYHAHGQRIAIRQGPQGQAGVISYLTTDYLGSTALVTDASGGVVNRTRYFPYGAIRTEEAGTSPTDRRFTGQRRETSTVYNYNARMYHTDIGRMPQADSSVPNRASPAAYNRYAYVVNNPVNMVDPTGRYWIYANAYAEMSMVGVANEPLAVLNVNATWYVNSESGGLVYRNLSVTRVGTTNTGSFLGWHFNWFMVGWDSPGYRTGYLQYAAMHLTESKFLGVGAANSATLMWAFYLTRYNLYWDAVFKHGTGDIPVGNYLRIRYKGNFLHYYASGDYRRITQPAFSGSESWDYPGWANAIVDFFWPF